MHNDKCFDVSTYKRMAAGQLPAAETEKALEHLERCDRCLQIVRNLPQDSIEILMRKIKRPANAAVPAFAGQVAQKELKQQGNNRGLEMPGVTMFSCPGCKNYLQVKSELAGQKVKCPTCGQVMQIPASDSATRGNPAEDSTAQIR